MGTPFESALLNLQLFDLRREPVLREARSWFLNDFNIAGGRHWSCTTLLSQNNWQLPPPSVIPYNSTRPPGQPPAAAAKGLLTL